jgi:hypothetical protein
MDLNVLSRSTTAFNRKYGYPHYRDISRFSLLTVGNSPILSLIDRWYSWLWLIDDEIDVKGNHELGHHCLQAIDSESTDEPLVKLMLSNLSDIKLCLTDTNWSRFIQQLTLTLKTMGKRNCRNVYDYLALRHHDSACETVWPLVLDTIEEDVCRAATFIAFTVNDIYSYHRDNFNYLYYIINDSLDTLETAADRVVDEIEAKVSYVQSNPKLWSWLRGNMWWHYTTNKYK